MNQKTVLAVDPGTAKCGMALVRRNDQAELEIMWRKVTTVEAFVEAVKEACAVEGPSMTVVGSGTGSKAIVQRLRTDFPSMGILVVDEENTSLQARERYWEHNRRRGWRRFLPATLFLPPEPFDDFVALILAERVLLG